MRKGRRTFAETWNQIDAGNCRRGGELMRFQLSSVALLLVCSVANAGIEFNRQNGDVSGVYATSDGSTRFGTAYAVAIDGEYAYWATTTHTVKSAKTVKLHKRTGTVISCSEADDVAIVRSIGEGVIPFSLADPLDGEAFTFGYPMEVKDLRGLSGIISDDIHQEIFDDGSQTKRAERSRMAVVCHPGWSGGPIVQRGRCVGMITASCSEGSLYVSSARIRYHLTQCISGQCRQSYTYRQRYLYRPAFVPPVVLPPRVDMIQTPIVQYEPTPAAPVPVPSSPQPESPAAGDTARRLGELETKIDAILVAFSEFKGTPGPQGERGPQGPPGINGANGKDATQAQVDAAVAKYLEANPPAVTVIVKDGESVVAEREGVRAGQTVTVPIKRTTVSK